MTLEKAQTRIDRVGTLTPLALCPQARTSEVTEEEEENYSRIYFYLNLLKL